MLQARRIFLTTPATILIDSSKHMLNGRGIIDTHLQKI